MADPLSPSTILALALHSQPKSYCIMLGSGASRGALVKTGWEVTKDLALEVACAKYPERVEQLREEANSPDWAGAWWKDTFSEELGYSQVIEKLTSNPVERRDRLSKYFTNTAEGELAKPSIAHERIARMVKAGYITTIVTTNFDRLIEKALEDNGVSDYQVISTEAKATTALPLSRGRVTVLKVNGDYADDTVRNTVGELKAEYPEHLSQVISQAFNDFGVIICGWSADWDIELRKLLESGCGRYGLYWDSRSSKGDPAKAIIQNANGNVIQTEDADHMFAELDDSLQALERMQVPQLTTDLAVAKLKRYLPDPLHRIELYDLVMGEADRVMDWVDQSGVLSSASESVQQLENAWESCLSRCQTLHRLVIAGVWHDNGSLDELWLQTLQKLADRSVLREGSTVVRAPFRKWPSFLLQSIIGTLASLTGREELFIKSETELTVQNGLGEALPFELALSQTDCLPSDTVKAFASGKYSRRNYPVDELLLDSLQGLFSDFVASPERVRNAVIDRLYRHALIVSQGPASDLHGYVENGLYISRHAGWTRDEPKRPFSQDRFTEKLDEEGRRSWEAYLGKPISDGVEGLRDSLVKNNYPNQPY
ncbi:hypothetical protein F8O07_07125 [Pseudoclavibacter sp. CFCC 13796]|uniref:SIR2 family protein n=1 Tax=Pseudoclavibacter sp. CFCC 13796 TaxID=2615179 RepID=UPI0013018F85|nr:SIR2 family protein [Pseudoclavibacter sp. CFCC 13796]KAB1661669.1 hypothetical protein F8O07_07125 [Pseudoclavibacter sp. CFCC 13796]